LAESLVATGGLEESEVVYRRILEKEPTVRSILWMDACLCEEAD